MKEVVISCTNLMMFAAFVICFFKRKKINEEQKGDYFYFCIMGMISTAMGFSYHYLRGQGKTIEEVQLLWDIILYATVVLSFFYTSIAVRIFSSSAKVLKNWKIFCKIKAVLFIIIQYKMAYFRTVLSQMEILIFLISSLLPIIYVFVGFLVNLRQKKYWPIGLGAFGYLLTIINRVVGKDLNDFFNYNSLMHFSIVILMYFLFQKIKRTESKALFKKGL